MLRSAGIRRLYWQAGELELRGGEFVFHRNAPTFDDAAQDGPEIVPVVRLATAIRSPEAFRGEALGRALRPVADTSQGRRIQLDFDCPDRLLPVYAERLRVARGVAEIRELTITALAGWSEAPGRAALFAAADAVFPMLYDAETDPVPGDDGKPRPVPLLDPAKLRARLESWRRGCQTIPWHAGLPAFARVTLYDERGRPRGHLRRWSWEDLVFHPALRLDRPPALGTTILRAERPVRIADSSLPSGGFLAARSTEPGVLREAVAAAENAGARSVVFFRLPESGAVPSLAQILALDSKPPRLRLGRDPANPACLLLCNDSDADLPPRLSGPAGERDRGYALEIESSVGNVRPWREALPGEFHRVNAHVFASADGRPAGAPIPLATRLTFWFSHLPAHAALRTGLVQLAPDADPGALRYRVLGGDDGARGGTWRPLE